MTAAESSFEAAEKIGGWIPRALVISQRTFVSYGQFVATNTVLLGLNKAREEKGARHPSNLEQVVDGYSHDSMSMAVIGLCSLLASADNKRLAGQGVVSLQAIYHRLKQPDVAAAFLDLWEEKHNSAFLAAWGRTRATAKGWVDEFLAAYRRLDWARGGSISRLQHLRNHGLAHLLERQMTESITLEELRVLMERLSEMTEPLGYLRLEVEMGRVSIDDATEWERNSLSCWRSMLATRG